MLINNKFLFISLPRCASTSFYISCIKNNLEIKHYNDEIDLKREQVNLSETNLEKFSDSLMHGHENIDDLYYKFGSNLEVISVYRNRHERFLSLWKHIIDEYYRIGEISEFEKLTKLTIDDILFFNKQDIYDIDYVINNFLRLNKINTKNQYLKSILEILYKPLSYYHKHDPNIIWFNFNELYKLEEWVSNKLEMNFKLEKVNSSQHFDCNVSIDDHFIEKYNNIYDIFDNIRKNEKTLI